MSHQNRDFYIHVWRIPGTDTWWASVTADRPDVSTQANSPQSALRGLADKLDECGGVENALWIPPEKVNSRDKKALLGALRYLKKREPK